MLFIDGGYSPATEMSDKDIAAQLYESDQEIIKLV